VDRVKTRGVIPFKFAVVCLWALIIIYCQGGLRTLRLIELWSDPVCQFLHSCIGRMGFFEFHYCIVFNDDYNTIAKVPKDDLTMFLPLKQTQRKRMKVIKCQCEHDIC